MARPFDRLVPNNLDLLAGVAVDLLHAAGEEDHPGYISSDKEDVGELEVGVPLFLRHWLAPPDEEDEEEQDEDWDEDDWDEDDGDSGYESEEEEDDEDDDEEDDDQRFPPEEFWHGWRQEAPPAQAVDLVGRPPTPDPQERAESPSPSFRNYEELLRPWDRLHPSPAASPPAAPSPVLDAAPGPGPAPAFLPLGGCKRARDEDEEEDPSSKRPRFAYFEDSPDDPSPSTSAGTSGGFRYFDPPHLFQDSSDSDDD